MSSATQPEDRDAARSGGEHSPRRVQSETSGPEGAGAEAVRLWRAASAESAAGRRHDALHLYERAAPLFAPGAAPAAFHVEFAALLAALGEAERREEYLDRALREYEAADGDGEREGDPSRPADIAHRRARLLLSLERTAEAHQQLDRAQRLSGHAADAATRAAVDETRARVLLAEARDAEAETLARTVVEASERAGEPTPPVSALTTHGVALARLGRPAEARASLRRAAAAAARAGDAAAEGEAALCMVEELSRSLPFEEVADAFDRAVERLAPTSSVPLSERLCAAARRVVRLAAEREAQHSWEGFSFKEAVHRYEAGVLARALADAGGSVSRAASLLGFRHHNSLASILNNRHRELLAERSPIKPRRRSIITVRERARAPRFAGAGSASIILHVEDDPAVADAVRGALEAEGCRVETCADGADALSRIERTAPYDLLLLDEGLPGVGGLDILRAVRALGHRRALPVIVFSAGEVEGEAREAGADLFLRKPQDASALPAAVKRLLAKPKQ